MKSGVPRFPVVAANLAVFCACAGVAFKRNIGELFYHYDGAYFLVDARSQLTSAQPWFAFTSNFLQSIGNIQLPENAQPLFYLWPLGWISDLQIGKIAVYLLIAAVIFLLTYKLARLLSQTSPLALTAAWIVGFLASPLMPFPFFYSILFSAPNFVTVIAIPVIVFWLVGLAGRASSLSAAAATGVGLVGLTFYTLAAVPIFLPIIAVGSLPYLVLALAVAYRRSQLLRTIAILAVATIAIVLLRWPWYVLGLFLDSAPNFFPDDFTVVYHDKIFASIAFHGRTLGWAGPSLAVMAFIGGLLSLNSKIFETRAAAWTVLIAIVTFVGAGSALTERSHWIFPPPIYFEVALWPLYGLFAAVTVIALLGMVVEALGRLGKNWNFAIRRRWIGFSATIALAVFVGMHKRPTVPVYPFPPKLSPVAGILRANIALDPSSAFNGRVLTAMPVKGDSGDAWQQQVFASINWAIKDGNDEQSVGLWYYGIPTLFEYNQFISPAFHALVKRALQRPPIPHQRNITVLTHADLRVLQLLGVRYVLMPQPDMSLGELRATEDRSGEQWGLIELATPNLATYSPTVVDVRNDLTSTLDFVMDRGVDLTRQATARESVAGPLVPARSSRLVMQGRDLHLTAESEGRTLVVVPLEFSHCIELHETPRAAEAAPVLLRIDGLLAGIVFDRHLDAVLSFRIGPLHNPRCRWEDYRDIRAMLH
jgi:hypothetical protein